MEDEEQTTFDNDDLWRMSCQVKDAIMEFEGAVYSDATIENIKEEILNRITENWDEE